MTPRHPLGAKGHRLSIANALHPATTKNARVATEISEIKGVRSTETSMYLEIVKNTYQWGIP
jgi:hypothetical protein